MLSNINSDKDQVLQIILAGQPELKDTLGLPELKQFVQRIAVDYHLGSLDLPMEKATFEFIDYTEDEADEFMKDYRKHSTRVGGG